ncbi:hypothetical protein [Actinomycetospora atypica]|uniref:DUF4386 family protein n=1 Tax=Actinomycetospora atypica TaxID=1290095 RepID=A0ABV9YMR2_9PSEU
MTTIDAPTTTLDVTGAAHAGRRSSGLTSAGGIALLATPVVMAGGMLTIPPGEDGVTTSSYLGSLAATPWLTGLSAGLLHYSWVLFALGVLAAPGLVRGRGRVLTGAVAAAMSFCAIQISGLLLGDWYGMALGRALPLDQAAGIFEAADANLWVTTWMYSGKLVGFAGVLLVTAALAWSRAVSWWLVALPVLGTVAMAGLGMLLGNLGAGIGMIISMAPLFVIGAKLLRQR